MKSHNISFEQHWEKVLQDDMQSLELIYKKYYPDLFVYARKLANDSDIAKDAIQDTFLYLWQNRKNIGTIKSLKFYLIRSVRNACLLLIKKKNNLGSLEDVDAHLSLIIQPSELKMKDEYLELNNQIKKSLDNLSPRQSEIIFLKFYNNLDYEEISEVLNINYQSVVNHVHKAIQKLRKSETLKYFQNL